MKTALEQHLFDHQADIEAWFDAQWAQVPPPFYTSVDIRNAGFKLAPVDTNLYPGGWNNLTPEMLPLAVQAAMAAIEKICPEARNLLIVPENHTRNTFYLSNVAQLQRIFHMAGLNVRIGSINPEIKEPTAIELPSGDVVTLEPVIRSKRRLGLKDFDPCTILLNNDLSAGIPGILEDLHEQFLLPPLHAGWSVRRKSKHFEAYEEVAKRFGKLLGIDPWLINPMFGHCGEVNFAEGSGMACLQSNVDALLTKIKRKYKEYGIHEKPFVVVKADNGTYGMGIMTVRDVKDLEALNRRTRNKMSVIKDGQTVNAVLIQEGVHTIERVQGDMAEAVMYLLGQRVAGAFYRVHGERAVDENLNAPGSHFAPVSLQGRAEMPLHLYGNGVVARLASLAASHEVGLVYPDVCIDACTVD